MAMYVFLWINGLELEAFEPETADTIPGVADGSISERKLASWVRAHVVPARR
jgi:prophage maintenance system killer protein